MEYLGYHNPSSLAKDLYKANQPKNYQIVNHVTRALIDLRNAVNKKKIPENKNPDGLINTVEKILDLNKR